MTEKNIKMINKDTHLKALALFTLAQSHYKRCREFEAELAELLCYSEDDDQYMGCLSDEIYDANGKFEVGLRKEGYSVNRKK